MKPAFVLTLIAALSAVVACDAAEPIDDRADRRRPGGGEGEGEGEGACDPEVDVETRCQDDDRIEFCDVDSATIDTFSCASIDKACGPVACTGTGDCGVDFTCVQATEGGECVGIFPLLDTNRFNDQDFNREPCAGGLTCQINADLSETCVPQVGPLCADPAGGTACIGDVWQLCIAYDDASLLTNPFAVDCAAYGEGFICDPDSINGPECRDSTLPPDDVSGRFQPLEVPSLPAQLVSDVQANDEDCYRVVIAAENSYLEAEVSSAPACPGDTILTIFDGDGETQLAQNDQGPGRGDCSFLALDVEPGAYVVCVSAQVDLVVEDVRVELRTGAIVDVGLGESCTVGSLARRCDPANNLECSAGICAADVGDRDDPEVVTTLPFTRITNLNPEDDEDCFRLTVSGADSYIRAETGVDADTCVGDTVLALLDENGDVVATNDQGLDRGNCSLLDVAVSAGDYRVCLTSFIGVIVDGVPLTIESGASVPLDLGEACVEGSNAARCDSQANLFCDEGFCAFDVGGSFAQPIVIPALPATVQTDLLPQDDLDCFAVTVTNTAALRAATSTTSADCVGDTTLTIVDVFGVELGSNDQGADLGDCSLVEIIATPGIYRVCVEEFLGRELRDVPVIVDARPLATVGPGQPCEEASLVAACDAAANQVCIDGRCALDAGGSAVNPALVTLPFDESVTLNPVKDADCFRFTLAANATVVLETGGQDAAARCVEDDSDTILTLFDEETNRVARNDDANEDDLELCSRITKALSAGSYTVCVTGFFGDVIMTDMPLSGRIQ